MRMSARFIFYDIIATDAYHAHYIFTFLAIRRRCFAIAAFDLPFFMTAREIAIDRC